MDDGTSRAGRRNAFGVIAGALFVIGPALAWLGIVRGLVAFVLFGLGGLTGVVVGVTSVIQAARGRGLGRGGAVALGVGVVFLALASRGVGKPRINDFTTDPADPPALARAAAVARQMDLTVTWRDPSAGLLEAMATSRLFGFHDDIAIRVRPEADGTSRIDMRSKSRDGQGDFGVNAARIRTFVQAIEAAGAPPP